MARLEQAVHEFARSGFQLPSLATSSSDVEWAKLRAVGTRLWLDTGDLDEAAKLWVAEFEALTTNNTLLNKEIQKGIYDNLVGEAATMIRHVAPDISERELVLEIAFTLNACHGLRLVEKFDANVSVELHTDLAHDVRRTVAYGKRYYGICPERFYVKVPLTPSGYLGARQLVEAGVPINFTLGFSARQNYLAALLTQPAYVNVFMGRLNSFVADNKLGTGVNVGEKATLATQRALLTLRKADRTKTQLIGASIRSGAQIGDCAGVDVFTMPPKAAAEYRSKPRANPISRVGNDPDIPLAPGVTLEQFNGDSLWQVTPQFKETVETLLKRDLDKLTPADLQAQFPDMLPRWSEAEVAIAAKDGKIPQHSTWRTRLESGQVGLDALMNLSALQSFATDQKALDDRIRSLLR